MLFTGDGGLDWSGLELAVEHFGVADVDDLVFRLNVIKTHRPPDKGEPPP